MNGILGPESNRIPGALSLPAGRDAKESKADISKGADAPRLTANSLAARGLEAHTGLVPFESRESASRPLR
jgi:hypothetical protein